VSLEALSNVSKWRDVTPQMIAIGFHIANCANSETGRCFPSITTISKRCNVSTRYVQKILSDIEKSGYITKSFTYDAKGRQTTSNYRFPNVKKGGELYATLEGEQEIVGEGEQLIVHNQEEVIRNKEVKTIVGKPDFAPERESVINYLNLKTGSRFKPTSVNAKKHIDARLTDHTVEDCMAVIDSKTAEWYGTDLQKFLRPETLFAGKFDSYLATAHIPQPEKELTSDQIMMNNIGDKHGSSHSTENNRPALHRNESLMGTQVQSYAGSAANVEAEMGADPWICGGKNSH